MSKQGGNSDPVVQGKLRNRERVAELQRVADLKTVMGLPDGRRFVYDLLFNKCGLMSVYPGSDSGIYRNEGRRTLGAEIVMELQQRHPELYLSMITEHLNTLTYEQKLRDAATTPSSGEEDTDA